MHQEFRFEKMTRITACIIAKNKEKEIEHCLKNLNFASEIILVDNNSSDKTLQVAKDMGAKALSYFEKDLSFSNLRNKADKLASCEWILSVDTDEIISIDLANEIKAVLDNTDYDGFYIKREDIFLDKKLQFGELKNAAHNGYIRLYKKNSGSWDGRVHERFVLKNKNRVSKLKNTIIHYSHKSVSDFLNKINSYSNIRSEEKKNDTFYKSIFAILFIPFIKFIHTYFILSGYKDKEAGFIYSFMMSFHSFLSRAKYENSSER